MSSPTSASNSTQVTSTSPIAKELARFQRQIDEIQDALEAVKLSDIDDPEAKLKAIIAKQNAMLKLPQLLSDLEMLKNKHKVKTDDVKGNKSLSPLEDGTLDE